MDPQSASTVTFPTAFATNNYTPVVSLRPTNSQFTFCDAHVASQSNTSMVVRNVNNAGITSVIYWYAIGY